MNRRLQTNVATYLVASTLLAACVSANAAVFLVGPGHLTTVQAGINAAVGAGGNNEVRVRSGTYVEHVVFTISSGSLDMSGGWNSTYTARDTDPSITLLAGGGDGRAISAGVFGAARFSLSGISVVGGSATDCGGGMFAVETGGALVQIRNSRFLLNEVQAVANNVARGGAFCDDLQDNAALIFQGNDVLSNTLSSENAALYGGGVFVRAEGASNVAINDNVIDANVAGGAAATAAVYGAGVAAILTDASQLSFARNRVTSNQAQVSSKGQGHASGAYVDATCAVGCAIDFNADIFDRNLGGFDGQFEVFQNATSGNSSLHLSNLLVARGQYSGMYLYVHSGTVNLTNLTIADNALLGLNAFDFVPFTLFNTIVYGNGQDSGVGNGSSAGNNLIGIDPHFIDAAQGNYRLRSDSPGRDTGTVNPPGGLGLFDLDGNARAFGAQPDIGAYEIGDAIFADGFQTGT